MKTNYFFGKQGPAQKPEARVQTNDSINNGQKGTYCKNVNVMKVPQSGKPNSTFLRQLNTGKQPRSRQSIAINRISSNCRNAEQMKQSGQTMKKVKELQYIVKVQGAYRRAKARKAYLQMLKKYRYRRSVIQELIKTEESYVADLDIIIHKIYEPMIKEKIISDEQCKILQSNIVELRKLNGEFLEELLKRFKTGVGPYQKIGDLLKDYVPYFKFYFQYYDDFKQIDQLTQALKRDNSKFVSFNKKMSESKDFRFLDFESFLVKPIQRLPKYVLLLKDLLKHTDPSHPDYVNIESASAQYGEVAEKNNNNLDTKLKNSRLFDLQKQYPDVRIIESNRMFISEEFISIFWKNKVKPGLVYLFSDLVLVTSRKNADCKYELIAYIQLNEASIIKSLPDTQFFTNLFTLIGDKTSVTFVEQTPESKQRKQQMFEDIIAELRKKADLRQEALSKNQIRVEKKNYQIEVQVVGTEQRHEHAFKSYTVYIIEISINNIVQRVYLRYKEVLDIQQAVKQAIPTLALTCLKESMWKSGTSAVEIESRTIYINSFLSTLLQSQEFSTSPQSKSILQRIRLPEDFYQLPEMLSQDTNQGLKMQRNGSVSELYSTLQQISPTKTSSLNALEEALDIREQRKLNALAMTVDRRTSQGGSSMGKKFSASKVLRSAGNSVEKRSTPEKKKKEKPQFIQITIITYHPKKQQIQLQLHEQSITQDLYEIVQAELEMSDIFDFRFVVVQSDKAKTTRVLGDDENIYQLFQPTGFLDKLLNDKKEVYFKKYIYLEPDMEELQFQNDKLKLDMVYRQSIAELGNFVFSFKEYCFLSACYFFINGIYCVKFPIERLSEIVPSTILKTTKKELWLQYIPEMYKSLVASIATEGKNIKAAPNEVAKIVFISNLFQHPLFSKQLFAVQACKETQALLKVNDVNLFVGVDVHGLSLFDNKKKNLLKFIEYTSLNQLKCYPASLLIEDMMENKYTLNCSISYQIKQIVDEYIALMEVIQESGEEPDALEQLQS